MTKRVYVDYSEVDDFVETLQNKGYNIKWDGWDIVLHTSDPTAFYSPHGKFDGTWGFTRRIKPRRMDGKWAIPINNEHS